MFLCSICDLWSDLPEIQAMKLQIDQANEPKNTSRSSSTITPGRFWRRVNAIALRHRTT